MFSIIRLKKGILKMDIQNITNKETAIQNEQQLKTKQEIINEISKYKVYRSLCIYRRTLNRKENQIPRTIKKLDSQTHFEIVPKIFEPEIDEGESEIASQYVSSWENMMGEEREEFLSEDEIRQMVKTYG